MLFVEPDPGSQSQAENKDSRIIAGHKENQTHSWGTGIGRLYLWEQELILEEGRSRRSRKRTEGILLALAWGHLP